MSERQSKKQRQTESVHVHKSHSGGGFSGINVVIAIVIAAFLGLGIYAVASKYASKRAAQQDNGQQTSQTVSQYAEEQNMSTEEFLAQYGLDGDESITGDSTVSEACAKMSVEKFAEFSQKSVDELKSENGLGDDVTADMSWGDARNYIPVGKMCEQSGIKYSDFLNNYGLTEEELPQDTKWSDAMPVLQEAIAKQQAEAAASASPEASAQPEETEAPTESPEAK